MFTCRYPTFAKGRILKRDMLENLRDYPRGFLDQYFQAHSDGILAGADMEVEGDTLIVRSGIIRHDGRVYMLEEPCFLPYQATETETIVKIRFKPADIQSDFTVYETELFLDANTHIRSDERELGRFKLKVGARLRQDYQNFYDFATEYNTVNRIHVAYAGRGESTFNPMILRYFAGEMLQSGGLNPYDVAFAMACMNGTLVDRELILHYLTNRLETEYREYTNEQIYKQLGRILEDVKHGGRSRITGKSRLQRMIVD
ncbi:hypothetical protein DFP93_104300 [Aneurinibacillus soli]|uniref:Uncharacterized protein n=1 Tax=Aneurinibacillus soli TaxID=1500254 RepID=A0A0U4WEN6_9BACL|nr:DNA and RNA helicase [Aneurinibacillus soli]PYE62647.1 hypothetical protein DFP93_104300 [Aneurinibacillus soli]BAU27208.1 hypothetical protein CB4_01377 [Aneurinibacillus soli]